MNIGTKVMETGKQHPKKFIAGGCALAIIGALLEFGPLCDLLPNEIGQVVCKSVVEASKHVVQEAQVEVGEPRIGAAGGQEKP